MLEGMGERLTRVQRHLSPFQQGNHPVNTGKRGEFAVAGNRRNTGTPVKMRVAGGQQQISRVSPAPLRQRLTGILRISKNSITTPEWHNPCQGKDIAIVAVLFVIVGYSQKQYRQQSGQALAER